MSKLSGVEKFKSKSEIVYDFLKLNILNGKLKPDERIAVADIAKILSVSGIPIREALTKLEAEGLITITPHIGASVVKIDKIKARRDPRHPDRIGGTGDAVGLPVPERRGF